MKELKVRNITMDDLDRVTGGVLSRPKRDVIVLSKTVQNGRVLRRPVQNGRVLRRPVQNGRVLSAPVLSSRELLTSDNSIEEDRVI